MPVASSSVNILRPGEEQQVGQPCPGAAVSQVVLGVSSDMENSFGFVVYAPPLTPGYACIFSGAAYSIG